MPLTILDPAELWALFLADEAEYLGYNIQFQNKPVNQANDMPRIFNLKETKNFCPFVRNSFILLLELMFIPIVAKIPLFLPQTARNEEKYPED